MEIQNLKLKKIIFDMIKKINKFLVPKRITPAFKRENVQLAIRIRKTLVYILRLDSVKYFSTDNRYSPFYLRGKVLCPDVGNFSGCFVL
jgi:hypothetical protein